MFSHQQLIQIETEWNHVFQRTQTQTEQSEGAASARKSTPEPEAIFIQTHNISQVLWCP